MFFISPPQIFSFLENLYFQVIMTIWFKLEPSSVEMPCPQDVTANSSNILELSQLPKAVVSVGMNKILSGNLGLYTMTKWGLFQ